MHMHAVPASFVPFMPFMPWPCSLMPLNPFMRAAAAPAEEVSEDADDRAGGDGGRAAGVHDGLRVSRDALQGAHFFMPRKPYYTPNHLATTTHDALQGAHFFMPIKPYLKLLLDLISTHHDHPRRPTRSAFIQPYNNTPEPIYFTSPYHYHPLRTTEPHHRPTAPPPHHLTTSPPHHRPAAPPPHRPRCGPSPSAWSGTRASSARACAQRWSRYGSDDPSDYARYRSNPILR